MITEERVLVKGFEFVKNKLGNLLDKDKKTFNQLTHDYKIRICNRNNLVVFAIKEENSMIILPTEVSVGDAIVDERSNKFYISKTEEINDFEITVNEEKKVIGVVKLVFDNDVLSRMISPIIYRTTIPLTPMLPLLEIKGRRYNN